MCQRGWERLPSPLRLPRNPLLFVEGTTPYSLVTALTLECHQKGKKSLEKGETKSLLRALDAALIAGEVLASLSVEQRPAAAKMCATVSLVETLRDMESVILPTSIH